MAEITEYSLVLLVSMLFVGASMAIYGAYTKFESASEVSASVAALVPLALQAAETGTASATILLPASTISCSDGLFAISTSGSVQNQRLPVDCNFSVVIPGGIHIVRFFSYASALSLVVT